MLSVAAAVEFCLSRLAHPVVQMSWTYRCPKVRKSLSLGYDENYLTSALHLFRSSSLLFAGSSHRHQINIAPAGYV